MGTSRETISRWFDAGKDADFTHMIVVCDTYDYEDYPVYVDRDEDVRDKFREFNGVNMQRVMEVYSFKVDKDIQMSETRAFHYE